MNKLIVTLAILGAISVMLYQVVDWTKVADEYEPIVNTYHKVVDMIPSNAEIIEAVEDVEVETVTEAITAPPTLNVDADPESPEIDNTDYDWLGGLGHDCYPTLPTDIKAAFENDDMIRQDEYSVMMKRCSNYQQAQDSGAKDELREMVR